MNPSKKTVANRLRILARDWSMHGIPDAVTQTLALYEAFEVEDMGICQAFQMIADYVDGDGDYINRDQDWEWC